MMRNRISRKESQLQTREHLLDAALKCSAGEVIMRLLLMRLPLRLAIPKEQCIRIFPTRRNSSWRSLIAVLRQESQGYPGIINLMNEGLQLEEGSGFKEQTMKDYTWNILMVEFFLYVIREGKDLDELAGTDCAAA